MRRRYRRRYRRKRRGHGILPYIKYNSLFLGKITKTRRYIKWTFGKSNSVDWWSNLIEKNEEKNNYVMRKLATPKRVTLPTGITFLARYKKLTRSAELPDNVIMARRYRGRVVAGRRRRSPRKEQRMSNLSPHVGEVEYNAQTKWIELSSSFMNKKLIYHSLSY